MKGKVLTEEHKRKISEKLIGIKRGKQSKEHKKKLSESHKGKKFTEKHKQNISKAHKSKQSYPWKGGYRSNNLPFYDTYAPQIEWCEEVRKSPTDKNILEVRCTYCGKWYTPKLQEVTKRIYSINGKQQGECRLYCSDNCKKVCPIYHKTPETLMKEDAIRAGRLGWLELNREVQPELRQLVLKRDKYQCVKCGSDGPLHCHHIYPVSIEFIESADIDNCITYCIDCHKEAHQKDGCGYGQLRMEVC